MIPDFSEHIVTVREQSGSPGGDNTMTDGISDIEGLKQEDIDKLVDAIKKGDPDELADAIYKIVSETPEAVEALGGNFTKEQIKSCLEKSSLTQYMEARATEYVEYLAGGKEPMPITTQEIQDLVSENLPIIEKEFDIHFEQSDIDMIQEVVADNTAEIEKITDIANTENTEVSNIIQLLRNIASQTTAIILAVSALLLIALLIVINKNAFRVLLFSGICFALCGLLFTICGMFASALSQTIADTSGFSVDLVSLIIGKVMSAVSLYGITALIGGFVMIIAGIIVKIITSKSAPVSTESVTAEEKPTLPEENAVTEVNETVTEESKAVTEQDETVTEEAAETVETETVKTE